MNKLIASALAIGVIMAGGYYSTNKFFQAPLQKANQQNLAEETVKGEDKDNTLQESLPAAENEVHKIVYTNEGYSPSAIKIKLGDTVVFNNDGSFPVWTASAVHPSHDAYGKTSLQEHCPDSNDLSFDQCQSSLPGESFEFKFDKSGTWQYHNHLKPEHSGKVIVEKSLQVERNF